MTKLEREKFLADLHVGIISIPEEGRGPLTVPIWYSYEPGGELRVVTGTTSRKAELLRRAGRFTVCAQTETRPYKYVSVEGPVVAIEPADLERDRRSLAVTWARKAATDTSRRHGSSTPATWLSACCRNDGSRWTTRRRDRHDRPSDRPEPGRCPCFGRRSGMADERLSALPPRSF